MKRLKYYLLQMQNDTATYREMYDGVMRVIPPKGEDWLECDNSYFHEDIMFDIEMTNKLSLDKPTVTYYIPVEKLNISEYTIAAADYCLRNFSIYIDELNEILYNRSRPDNENGKYYLYRPGGEVLKRNTTYFTLKPQKSYRYVRENIVSLISDDNERLPKMCLAIKLMVQLPKRKIRKTIQMLCRDLPEAIDNFIEKFDCNKFNEAIALEKKQQEIRKWLKGSEYCAFIANESILPRFKGTELPMQNAVPFKSTLNDEIEVCGIKGMGIKRGVTVITGGGYSGKSTLLDAIASGIYNHIKGDGRELCITDESAVTICAEDGRSIKNVNISPFIKWLPGGDTENFSTDRASGSTSQAANIMEAVNVGAKLLLIDEDKSATNFMIRDRMMKELIHNEPITPFTDRVNELYKSKNVSTILVIGGSGEYLAVADKVYIMEDFLIHDITEKSKIVCGAYGVTKDYLSDANWTQKRKLSAQGFTSYPEGSGSEKLEVSDMGFILIGNEQIDVRGLNNVITQAQFESLGFMLRWLETTNKYQILDIEKQIDLLYDKINEENLDIVFSSFFTTCERFLDLPRKVDLLALINRMRKTNYIIPRG